MQGFSHLSYVCSMNSKWLKLAAILLVIIGFACCRGGKKGTEEAGKEFKDPVLKDITDKIREEPQNALLYYQRGMLLHKMTRDTLALKDFKKAVSLDSSRAEYYSAVGDLLFEHK